MLYAYEMIEFFYSVANRIVEKKKKKKKLVHVQFFKTTKTKTWPI